MTTTRADERTSPKADGMQHRMRSKGAALLVVLSLTAVAACTSTQKSQTTSSTSAGTSVPAGSTTRGVTDTAVKVGGLMYSGFFSGADVGAQARINRANQQGGVNGRKIDLVGVHETNNNQPTVLASARNLVLQDGVFALLPVASSNLGLTDFVTKEKVPMFGYGVDPSYCGNPYAFGVSGCVADPALKHGSDASGQVVRTYFKGDSNKTVAVIGEDFDAGVGGVKLQASSLSSAGFKIVYAKNPVPAPPAPVSDWSPFVSAVLKSNNGGPPDVIYGVLTGASAIGFYQAVKAAGYHGLTIIPSYDPRAAAIVSGAGTIIQFAPFESAPQIPQLQQMINDVKAVKPDQPLTVGVAVGYWSTDLFLALLQKTGRDLTVEKFLAASNGWSHGVPQIVGTSVWPKDHDYVVPCASLVIAQGGTYVPTVPLTCGNNIEITS